MHMRHGPHPQHAGSRVDWAMRSDRRPFAQTLFSEREGGEGTCIASGRATQSPGRGLQGCAPRRRDVRV